MPVNSKGELIAEIKIPSKEVLEEAFAAAYTQAVKDITSIIEEMCDCELADSLIDTITNFAKTADKVKKPDPRIKKIADYYGYESQMDVLTEECGEFVQARNKLRRNVLGAYNNCLEEIADIAVMIEQMKLICGEDRILSIMDEKLDRQIARIKEIEDHEEPRPLHFEKGGD